MDTDFREELELAWGAGFYDGEGCTTTQRLKGYGPGRDEEYLYLSLQVVQCDREPLDRWVSVFGGTVQGPYGGNDRHRPRYRWTATGRKAAAILARLWPYLSAPKRRQIVRVISQPDMRHVDELRLHLQPDE